MKVALIGYGEVGRILAEELSQRSCELTAFDLKLRTPERQRLRQHAEAHGVMLTESHLDAVRHCELIVSAVTASQTLAAAKSCIQALTDGCFFLDLNSASPGAKIAAFERVSSAGGRYVEAAVMTSIPAHRIQVPMLLGGPYAQALMPVLDRLGFAASIASRQLGVASATKMCRSVVVKGLEAIVIESLTAARHYGVEHAVLASLAQTFPAIDWDHQASYFFQRVIEHGARRSEEMREAAVTVADAGVCPLSATSTAERQAWVAKLADASLFGPRDSEGFARSESWYREADRILAHVHSSKGQ